MEKSYNTQKDKLMLYLTILRVALKSIMANKLRSFLAMLGIIIGTGAVISMLALGTGAQAEVMDKVNSMGTNLISIMPNKIKKGGIKSSNVQRLSLEDAEAMLKYVPDIQHISPIVRSNSQIKYFEENTPATVIGSAVTYFAIRNYEIDKGRLFTENEVVNSARTAVLGSELAETLFGDNNPVGENIKIDGMSFEVVGVLKTKGSQGMDNMDEAILVPYTVAMKQMFGKRYLDTIDVSARDGSNLTQVQEDITTVLRSQHKLSADKEDDFRIFNQAELIETSSNVNRTFTILLGSIAGISLLVGGIGIMNIMFVTVTERTREIGVRKAIGARSRDILLQFLLESILICALGGALGVLIGTGTAKLTSLFTDYPTQVQAWTIILSLFVSTSVGTFFGYYPAKRAAQMDPIDALRYE